MRSATVMCFLQMCRVGPPSAAEPAGEAVVRIDCARAGPAELVRKFDMCQTGWSSPAKWVAAAKGRIKPIGCRQVRLVGALLHSRYGKTPLSDEICAMLKNEGAAPYVCLDPNILGGRGDYAKNPTDMTRWRKIVRSAARQAKKYGGVWFEVWNEPNHRRFWQGTQAELFELYRVMVEEVRTVHPTAKFVGPGITSAGIRRWLAPFLDYVQKHKLPLDAVSFHDFGRDYTLGERWILPNVKACLGEIDKRPYFKNRAVEIHVGECSFFDDPKDGDEADRAAAAARVPRLFRLLLTEPRLTLVQWAQLFDTGHPGHWGNLGVIDAETRKPKPIYNVFLMYEMMPVRSAFYEMSGPLGCLASQDGETVAVMLENTSATESLCRIEIRNLPFKAGSEVHAYLFAVDKAHSSFWDTPGSGRLELIRHRTLTGRPGDKGDTGSQITETQTIPTPGVRLLLLTAKRRTFDPKGIVPLPPPAQ